MIKWLRLCAFIAKGPGPNPVQGDKIPQASRCGQKKKKASANPEKVSVSVSHSVVSDSATPWTVTCQAPLSMGFSRQEYWSGLPLPSPGDLPDSGIEAGSPVLQADSSPSEPPS